MDYVIAFILLGILCLTLRLVKLSFDKAKRDNLLSDEVIVSKAFYEASLEVNRLLNDANSVEEQRRLLPEASAKLSKEIRENARKSDYGMAKEVC